MNIVEFHEQLVEIMHDRQTDYDSLNESKYRLETLLSEAKDNKLNVNVSLDILDDIEVEETDSSMDSSMC